MKFVVISKWSLSEFGWAYSDLHSSSSDSVFKKRGKYIVNIVLKYFDAQVNK